MSGRFRQVWSGWHRREHHRQRERTKRKGTDIVITKRERKLVVRAAGNVATDIGGTKMVMLLTALPLRKAVRPPRRMATPLHLQKVRRAVAPGKSTDAIIRTRSKVAKKRRGEKERSENAVIEVASAAAATRGRPMALGRALLTKQGPRRRTM